MNYLSNIKKLYIIIFFHNLIPAYVIERLFNAERGITVQMVVYCEFIYAITILLLELPSGAIADILGRKKLILIGSLMACMEFFILIYSTQFWHFAAVAFLAGIGTACTSGAWNALLYDSLQEREENSKGSDFEKVLGRMNAIDFSAGMLAALLGGVLASRFNLVTNYYVSFVSAIIALVCTFTLKETVKTTENKAKSVFFETVKKAFVFLRNNKSVLAVIVQIMAVAACINYADEFWQTYLSAISFPVALFGIISSIFALSRIPGALVSSWLLKFFRTKTILTGSCLIAFAGLTASALLKNPVGIIGIAAAFFASEIMSVTAMGYLHHKADESARATIESFSSLLERGFVIMAGLLFGYISIAFSIFSGFLTLGAICGVIALLFIFIHGFIHDN